MVEKVRVPIVDDSAFFHWRIREQLGRTGGILIPGEAGDGRRVDDPCARPRPDLLLQSMARTLGQAELAAVGASVWSRHEASSVAFGMPYAVAKAGCPDRVLPQHETAEALAGLA